jgi:hypothetical protein
MDIANGRSVLVVSFDAADVQDLGTEHLALAEEFAAAGCALRDELLALLAAKDPAS